MSFDLEREVEIAQETLLALLLTPVLLVFLVFLLPFWLLGRAYLLVERILTKDTP